MEERKTAGGKPLNGGFLKSRVKEISKQQESFDRKCWAKVP